MKLKVMETTDGKYRGREFEIDPNNIGPVEVEPGIVFRIQKVENMGDGILRFSNDNYIAYAKIIG